MAIDALQGVGRGSGQPVPWRRLHQCSSLRSSPAEHRQTCHLNVKRTITFFLHYFLVGENKLFLSAEIILLWCESLNPRHSVSSPLSSSSPAHMCSILLYGPAHLVLLHVAVPRIVLLARSHLLLLSRQNGPGMQGILWFTEVGFYSGIRDKQICAYTVGSQSWLHEHSMIIKQPDPLLDCKDWTLAWK